MTSAWQGGIGGSCPHSGGTTRIVASGHVLRHGSPRVASRDWR
jgi:hypothetical protein